MNHFPIQRVLFNSPQGLPTAHKVHRAQNITIDQLRQENEFLKRQLSDLMKTQSRGNRVDQNALFSKTGSVNKADVDVQETFKRKMSKIKSRNSSRKSVDHYNQTMPCSPHKIIQQPIRNITNLCFQDSPLKVMVIQQDQKGRYFRNKEKEDKLPTVRNASVSKVPSSRNSCKVEPDIRYERFLPEPKFRKDTKVHKRIQSNLERLGQNEEVTERMVSRKTQLSVKPPSVEFSKEKEGFNINTSSSKSYNIPFVPISPPRDTEKKPIKHQSKELVKPSLASPRGNIYVQQVEVLKPKAEDREPSSEQSIPEDSMVSIAKGLRQKKSVRKLRYDIYLSDDLQNS